MNVNNDIDKLERYLAVETRSIVLVGDFLPVMFQPFWLSSKGIIREEEAQNAKVDVMTNEFSQFKIGEWLDITIDRNRCQLKTKMNPYFPVLKDTTEQVFELLKENPVRAIGLNYVYSLNLEDNDKYYHIGKVLASLSKWDNILNKPKLNSIVLKSDKDENGCNTFIKIYPTDPNLKIYFGLDLSFNNHFAFEGDKANGLNASNLLSQQYDTYSIQSKVIANKIIKEFLDNE